MRVRRAIEWATEGDADAQRMLVIGLDAADRELIEVWCAEGFLPNIQRMKDTGAWANLATTADVLHVSAWPSIYSGTTPDKHGLYHAYVMDPGTQTPVRPNPEKSPVPVVWKLLNDAGLRSVVMDGFLTCPLRDFDGVQIVDWGSWTWFSGHEISPPEVKAEVTKRFGPYPSEDHSKVGMTPPPDPLGWRDRLLGAVAKKSEVIDWLMTTQDWDFFMVVFGECHAAGHYYWHYQDEDYIAHPENCDPRLKTALRDVYVALDTAIGECLERVGPETLVILTSGDGMGPNYSGSHLLQGLLDRVTAEPKPDEPEPAAPQKPSFLSRLRQMVPKEFRAAVSRYILPRSINEKLSLHWKTEGIDWSKTKAFTIENANEGYVRINVEGREPEGIVQPGSDYDDLCDKLAGAASTMTNPETGRAAAEAVHIAKKRFPGPCCDALPDVIINWDPSARVTKSLATEDYGLIESEQAGYEVSPYYTGNHLANAFMAATGGPIEAGQELHSLSILDIAPTILAHFGLTIPDHMDGAKIPALLPSDESDT